ncbi:hypothetical protein FNV43_RR18756 [Rhamnella rubrinervis]|uniref:Transmembrane protein n=1 Tax=Rhamnella rubrinervis TaxID=2594499 RepID=A0A8K0GT82_9ROSA|nr:hypothetical protein FNV43_RR18756 [Rhamnella rubrinervis]
MEKFSRATAILLFWFIVVSIQFPSTIGEVDHLQQGKPSLAKAVIDTLTSFKESHQGSWDKVKTIIHGFQLKFFPPNLDFRGSEEGKPEGGGAGEKVKEAVEKSFTSSRETVEEAAKSAADAVGETVHKTAQKVKETVHSDKESQAEL